MRVGALPKYPINENFMIYSNYVKKLNRKFDIIESAGVLHHMDNPLDGWRVLTSCLKKGGLIRLGLYSELGRLDIVKFQNEISISNVNLSDNTIKYFRNLLLDSKHEHHNQIKRSLKR